jgi:hypothetical protein
MSVPQSMSALASTPSIETMVVDLTSGDCGAPAEVVARVGLHAAANVPLPWVHLHGKPPSSAQRAS